MWIFKASASVSSTTSTSFKLQVTCYAASALKKSEHIHLMSDIILTYCFQCITHITHINKRA